LNVRQVHAIRGVGRELLAARDLRHCGALRCVIHGARELKEVRIPPFRGELLLCVRRGDGEQKEAGKRESAQRGFHERLDAIETGSVSRVVWIYRVGREM